MSDRHSEPIIIEIGFKPNRRGDWWYHEPNNRYTLQIVPANISDPTKDERGWRLGIARPGGMRWGKMVFPAPEAAALHDCRVVKDNQLRDHIASTMVHKHQQDQTQIRRALHNFMKNKQ